MNVQHNAIQYEEQSSPVDASLRGVYSVDANTCWASGANGTVLLTTDTGEHWNRVSIPGGERGETTDFRDIHAFDAATAIVMGIGSPALFYKTDDAGQTWREVFADIREGVFFDAFDFWDERRGIAFSDPIGGKFIIMYTHDAGETWTQISPDVLPPALDGEAGFAGSGTGLIVGNDGIAWIGLGGATNAGGARVLRTTDFGQTWTIAGTPIRSTEAAGIFSIVFQNEHDGIAIGGDYQNPEETTGISAVTTNGGSTWTLLEGDNAPNGYRSGVDGMPVQSGKRRIFLCIAVGPTGIDIGESDSENSVIKWRPFQKMGYHAVSWAADGSPVAWATGADGRICKLSFPN